MPKTYDEKREKFQQMMESRLPKAVKAIELLSNLSRKSDYAWTQAELQDMLDRIDDAVDGVAQSFGVAAPETPAEEEVIGVVPPPAGEPRSTTSIAVVDGVDRRDIRAVLRMLHAGDTNKATQLLQKIVCGWPVPDQVEGDGA